MLTQLSKLLDTQSLSDVTFVVKNEKVWRSFGHCLWKSRHRQKTEIITRPEWKNCFKFIPIFSLWPRTVLLRMKRQMAATWQSTPDLQDFQSADGSYSTYPIFSRFVGHCEREWSDECTCLYSVTSTEIKFQRNEFIEIIFGIGYTSKLEVTQCVVLFLTLQ